MSDVVKTYRPVRAVLLGSTSTPAIAAAIRYHPRLSRERKRELLLAQGIREETFAELLERARLETAELRKGSV